MNQSLLKLGGQLAHNPARESTLRRHRLEGCLERRAVQRIFRGQDGLKLRRQRRQGLVRLETCAKVSG